MHDPTKSLVWHPCCPARGLDNGAALPGSGHETRHAMPSPVLVAYDLRLGGRDQQESAVGDEVVPKAKVGTGFQNRMTGHLFAPIWEQTALGMSMSTTILGFILGLLEDGLLDFRGWGMRKWISASPNTERSHELAHIRSGKSDVGVCGGYRLSVWKRVNPDAAGSTYLVLAETVTMCLSSSCCYRCSTALVSKAQRGQDNLVL